MAQIETTQTTHHVGPLVVGVKGRNPIAELVRAELSPESGGSVGPDIVFHFLDDNTERKFNPTVECGNNLSFNKADICVEEEKYSYHTKGLFENQQTTVFIHLQLDRSPSEFLLDIARRLFGPSFQTRNERVKTNVCSYTTLWPLLHIELLQKNCAFIHASVVDYGGDGTVIAGTGGSGKTSTCFEFLENSKYKYVAEDFGILRDDGCSSYSPRSATIYYSDYTHGQSDISSYVEGELGGLNKLHWWFQIQRGRNPKRKVSPEQVVGSNRVAKETRVKQAYYVTRTNGQSIDVSQIPSKEFVNRALWASFRELKRFYDLLSQTESAGVNTEIPSLIKLKEETVTVYQQCLSDTDTFLLKVPFDASPGGIVPSITGK